METAVQYVRRMCKEKGIAISKLEKDLKFGNGYLNPKKGTKIPYDLAVMIAEYLHCDINPLLSNDSEERVIRIVRPNRDAIEKSAFDDGADYYEYRESQQIAQQIMDDADLRALFDAARDSRPEDLAMAMALLKRLKETNRDG